MPFLTRWYLWKNEEKDGHEDGRSGRPNGDQGVAKSFHFEGIAPARHEDWRLQFLLKILTCILAYLEEPQCNQDDKEDKDLNIVRC